MKQFRLTMIDLGLAGDNPIQLAQETFSDPGPGVDPIEANVVNAAFDGDDVIIDVILDPKDYIRQAIQFGEDPYEILSEFKGQLSSEEFKEIYQWLKTDEFNIAHIARDMSGDLDVTQIPSRPDL